MKAIILLVILFSMSSFAKAQACGYTKLTVYLTDWQDRVIKTATIKTFDKEFKNEDRLHFPIQDETNYDSLTKDIAWNEKKQAYFGREGMCGGHYKVGLRISADGFENFDNVIDLPLGWTSYAVKLKRKNSPDVAEIIKSFRVCGTITDNVGAIIPNAKVEIKLTGKKTFVTYSDENGEFNIEIPKGIYKITISAESFKKTVLKNQVIGSESECLTFKLKSNIPPHQIT